MLILSPPINCNEMEGKLDFPVLDLSVYSPKDQIINTMHPPKILYMLISVYNVSLVPTKAIFVSRTNPALNREFCLGLP